jgi:hypothetical protein
MATTADITVDQGTTVKIPLTFERLTTPNAPYNASTNPYVAVDLTGATLSMMVRATYDSKSPTLSLSSDGASPHIIVTDAAGGLAELRLQPSDTTNVKVTGESFEGVYDLEIDDGAGIVSRAFQGIFTITREVTR